MESGPRVGCMGMDRCITKMVLWSGRFVCVFSVKCGVYICGCGCGPFQSFPTKKALRVWVWVGVCIGDACIVCVLACRCVCLYVFPL